MVVDVRLIATELKLSFSWTTTHPPAMHVSSLVLFRIEISS